MALSGVHVLYCSSQEILILLWIEFLMKCMNFIKFMNT
jgi:hypothetical protein